MTELYLIRHTHAEGNLYRLMQGQWDGGVTPLGLRQIDALSQRFREIPVDAVYASDLSRAVMTAEGIAGPKNLPVQQDMRLRELDLGPWESQFFGNVSYNYPQETDAFLHAPENWHISGAETMEDVSARALEALTEIATAHDGKTVAVVSHGVTIRCVLSKILNLRLAGEELLPLFKNTSVTDLQFENGSFTVKSMGDFSHVENLLLNDWISTDALRDEVYDPAEDPAFYMSCYENAWHLIHPRDAKQFCSQPYYQSALEHHAACPGAVRRLYVGDECAGIIDCDVRHGAHANYGWISFLYLLPAWRGKGYGIQALARALVLYRHLGRSAIRLNVSASNPKAIQFYEKNGFSVLSCEPGASGPLYLMEKKIGNVNS